MQHINAFQQSIMEITNELNTLLSHIHNSKNAGDRVAARIQELERKLEDLLYLDKKM